MYSANRHNPVGAEYVIVEKAQGMQLKSIWYDMQEDSQKNIVNQVVDFETKLQSIAFTHHGSLYFKKDLEDKRVSPYKFEDLKSTVRFPENLTVSDLLNEYAMGPSTEAKIWEDERETMEMLSRGPC